MQIGHPVTSPRFTSSKSLWIKAYAINQNTKTYAWEERSNHKITQTTKRLIKVVWDLVTVAFDVPTKNDRF